ncbi:MAG: Holliday junction branch migration protein RuvA [Deltaproteobacteria bacterium]|nr:Holliday junction branch migration protein RuvA [Deltaproteobacteria bacterium]
MIAHLKGTLLSKTTQSIVVDNGGVGYEVFVPLSTFYALPECGGSLSLHIHTHVREDAIVLFGFQTTLEKNLFMMLISVSGIGPKLALNILSGMGPDELLEAIARGDGPRLQSIPGVGRKTAERIALELREKAQKALGDRQPFPADLGPGPDRRILDDALSALINLGYSAKLAKGAVEKASSGRRDAPLEDLIREALRLLA